MIIIKLISSEFKKNLESKCSNFYLGGLGLNKKKKQNILYKNKIKIASSGGSFEPPKLYIAPLCFL